MQSCQLQHARPAELRRGVGDGIVDLRAAAEPVCDGARGLSRPGARSGQGRQSPACGRTCRSPRSSCCRRCRRREKILCIGINYANRDADYDFGEQRRAIPEHVLSSRRIRGRAQPADPAAEESEQLDYEGEIALVIGASASACRRSARSEYVAGITLCNEGTIRDWIRHGQFNVTQGKNLDSTGSIGPWIDDRSGSDKAAAHRRAQRTAR